MICFFLIVILQVVVQQLNFVEKGFSSLVLNDHDSDSITAGKSYLQ